MREVVGQTPIAAGADRGPRQDREQDAARCCRPILDCYGAGIADHAGAAARRSIRRQQVIDAFRDVQRAPGRPRARAQRGRGLPQRHHAARPRRGRAASCRRPRPTAQRDHRPRARATPTASCRCSTPTQLAPGRDDAAALSRDDGRDPEAARTRSSSTGQARGRRRGALPAAARAAARGAGAGQAAGAAAQRRRSRRPAVPAATGAPAMNRAHSPSSAVVVVAARHPADELVLHRRPDRAGARAAVRRVRPGRSASPGCT